MAGRVRDTHGWTLREGVNDAYWDRGTLERLYKLTWAQKILFRVLPHWAPWVRR